MASNLDPIQQHTLSLFNLISTFQSLQNVHLNSVMDEKNLKYCHIPTAKGKGMLQVKNDLYDIPLDKGEKVQVVNEAEKGWGTYLSETFYGEWRIRRDELQRIMTVFDSALTVAQNDALKKNINEWDLKALNQAIIKLDTAVNSAADGLKNLQTEFETNAKASWTTNQSRSIEFAKFINDFINQTQDKSATARELIEQRLDLYQFQKSQAAQPSIALPASSLVTPSLTNISPTQPIVESNSPQIVEASPVCVLVSSSLPIQNIDSTSPSIPKDNVEGNQQQQPLPTLALNPELPIESAQSKKPDLEHYHHPYFKGHHAFSGNPDYSANAPGANSSKKTGYASEEVVGKAIFLGKLRKGELEKDAGSLFNHYRKTLEAYERSEKIVAKKPLVQELKPDTNNDTPKASPPPPPPPKLKGKPAAKPLAQNDAKGPTEKSSPQAPKSIEVSENSKKFLEAIEIEARFKQAEADLIQLLLPEFANNKIVKFTPDEFNRAYTIFLNDLRAITEKEKSHGSGAPTPTISAAKQAEDKEKQKAIEPIQSLINQLNKIQVEIKKLETAILKNNSAVSNLAREINTKITAIKSASEATIEGLKKELLALNQQHEIAKKRVSEDNPMLEAKIANLKSDLKKPIKLLNVQINAEIEKPIDLIAAAEERIKDIQSGKLSATPAKKSGFPNLTSSKPIAEKKPALAPKPTPKTPKASKPVEENITMDPRLTQSLFISDGPIPMHDMTASMLTRNRTKRTEDPLNSLLSSKMNARRETLKTSTDGHDDDSENDFDDDFGPMSFYRQAPSAGLSASVNGETPSPVTNPVAPKKKAVLPAPKASSASKNPNPDLASSITLKGQSLRKVDKSSLEKTEKKSEENPLLRSFLGGMQQKAELLAANKDNDSESSWDDEPATALTPPAPTLSEPVAQPVPSVSTQNTDDQKSNDNTPKKGIFSFLWGNKKP